LVLHGLRGAVLALGRAVALGRTVARLRVLRVALRGAVALLLLVVVLVRHGDVWVWVVGGFVWKKVPKARLDFL
jgi:hypothetical protein